MPGQLANNLDLALAWRRAKFDRPDRCFVSHPFLIELVELDLDEWLADLRQRIAAGFSPSPALVCQEPKGGGLVRPGTCLQLEDEVVFNAAVGSSFQAIAENLRWSRGNPDVAYQLAIARDNPEWVSRGFIVWKQFREKSLGYLASGFPYVLFADISAFYENIDLGRLASDLRRVGIAQETVRLLSACLNRWAEPRGKGIPQGYSAADILAKLYMEPVDQTLRIEGFKHLRYVDDIRVFCGTELEARKALLRLSELLRTRGLNLQSAKTYIRTATEAAGEIDGVAPVIARIQEELRDELSREFAIAGPYATLAELEELTAGHPDHPPLEVLERAFGEHFGNPAQHEFNKTLFHYLLTRLGQVGSKTAVDYCSALFARRPEETKPVLKYLERIKPTQGVEETILDFVLSDDAIYEYQKFLMLRFFYDMRRFPAKLIHMARQVKRDRNCAPWLRAYAVAILGEAGTAADLEDLEATYPNATEILERSEVICSLLRMETGRRNAFTGRAQVDGALPERAARWVQAH